MCICVAHVCVDCKWNVACICEVCGMVVCVAPGMYVFYTDVSKVCIFTCSIYEKYVQMWFA